MAAPWFSAWKSRRVSQDPRLAFDQIVGHPRGLPQLPPQGAWGEVINATPRWLVIQNHSGQQYPIALEDIGEFLVRWPSSVDAMGAESLVEAVGNDLGSNVVEVTHVDVFEGTDRSLVSPTYNSLLANNAIVTTIDPTFNRFMNAWDYAGQSMLYGWAYPFPNAGNGISSRLHVVGSWSSESPLRLAVPGNNFATIAGVGQSDQFTVSQVTRGTMNHPRKGDYAFMLPKEINAKGLAVSQLILYKTITLPAVQSEALTAHREADPRLAVEYPEARWRPSDVGRGTERLSRPYERTSGAAHRRVSAGRLLLGFVERPSCGGRLVCRPSRRYLPSTPYRRRPCGRAEDTGSRPRESGSRARSE